MVLLLLKMMLTTAVADATGLTGAEAAAAGAGAGTGSQKSLAPPFLEPEIAGFSRSCSSPVHDPNLCPLSRHALKFVPQSWHRG
jgi:hypothetical protein